MDQPCQQYEKQSDSFLEIMKISKDTTTIKMNSRHNQSMVHSSIQDYVQEKPLIKYFVPLFVTKT